MSRTTHGRAAHESGGEGDDEVPPLPPQRIPRVREDDIPELPEDELPELSQDEVAQPPEPHLPPVERQAEDPPDRAR